MKKNSYTIKEKKKIPQFDLGDVVYMKVPHSLKPFEPKYCGPFKI